MADYREAVRAFYARAHVEGILDVDAAFDAVERVLPGALRLSRADAPENELAFVTKRIREADFDGALKRLQKVGISADNIIRISAV